MPIPDLARARGLPSHSLPDAAQAPTRAPRFHRPAGETSQRASIERHSRGPRPPGGPDAGVSCQRKRQEAAQQRL